HRRAGPRRFAAQGAGTPEMSAPSLTTAKPWLPEVPRAVYVAALVVGAVFFITEHNVRISLAEDYTQDAEAMLETVAGGNLLRRLAFIALAGLGLTLLLTSPARWRWGSIHGVLLL